ncbi:hypothetical protein [Tenacibaculum jejuense]|uniref:hypothetical protein n=1 Tax=Tenacibaculum jejuense TaxID=584609 RepID=UPI000BA3AE56|nr:hypothetical protein [Tenacibaculum jejuense]
MQKKDKTVSFLSKKTTVLAGESVKLEFSASDDNIQLFCTSSYSTVILTPKRVDKIYQFDLPKHLTNKRGDIVWNVIHQNKTLLTGNITVLPSKEKTIMESYAGPPSIVAGGEDYFMLTVCPTDEYDNPLLDDTNVLINYQFDSKIVSSNEKIKNLTAWKTIFSYEKSGRFLVNSECNGVSSKEITTEVYPNNAVRFKITSSRYHDYADGNQIASFKTSVIKDSYGNIVSDGTHVVFVTKNISGDLLTSYGNTIAGVATGKMLHPDRKESWKTFAYVDGIAESDTLNIKFKELFTDFQVKFSEDNREITVGPIKSFMNQLIPDGFVTKLNIYQKDTLLEIKEVPTRKGYAKFYLHPDFYIENSYGLKIETGGITKNFIKALKN